MQGRNRAGRNSTGQDFTEIARPSSSPAEAAAGAYGRGLGLAIARANAGLHGGALTLLADTTETTFELWLPLRSSSAPGG